jgi:hypothetical protein
MSLFHRETMKELNIDKTISIEFDEYSEEYKELCATWKNVIGFERESDKDKFDKALMILMNEETKTQQKNIINNIEDVIRKVYKDGASGYVEFGGYIINPADFCAIRINEIKAKFFKG